MFVILIKVLVKIEVRNNQDHEHQLDIEDEDWKADETDHRDSAKTGIKYPFSIFIS